MNQATEGSGRGLGAPRWAIAGLVAVFAFGTWLRLDGIDWQLPYFPEPDNVVALQLADLEAGTPPAERMIWFQRYPLLMARLAGLLPAAGIPASDDLEAHLRAASTVTLRIRIVNAVISSFLVLLTWSLARRFLGPAGALLASAFVAASVLDLLFSQQARCHGSQATLSLLAVIASLRLRAKPSWGRYALAGLACASAVALLQNGLATLPPLLAAHVLAERDPAERHAGSRAWRIVLPVAIVASAFPLFYPGGEGARAEQEGRFVLDSEGFQARGHKLRFENFRGQGFPLLWGYLRDHEPALLALALLGIVLALPALARRWKDRDLAVVLAYAVPYLVAVGLYRVSQERFLVPLLPFMACLASFAVLRVASLFALPARRPALRVLLGSVPIVAALALPVAAVLKFASVRDAPDTVEQAARWIREHVDPEEGTILVTPSMTLPLFHDPATLDPTEPPLLYGSWVRYQAKLPPSATRGPAYRFVNVPPLLATRSPSQHPGLAERLLEENRPAYVVFEVSKRSSRMNVMNAIRELVVADGELVFEAASEAGDPLRYRPLGYSEMPRMLSRLFRVTCFGPRIEIWRTRRD